MGSQQEALKATIASYGEAYNLQQAAERLFDGIDEEASDEPGGDFPDSWSGQMIFRHLWGKAKAEYLKSAKKTHEMSRELLMLVESKTCEFSNVLHTDMMIAIWPSQRSADAYP